MATFPTVNLSEVLAAPLGDLIASVGRGVATAQQAMDAATIETMQSIYGGSDSHSAALRDLGYKPAWYHIPEATAELSVALTIDGTSGAAADGRPAVLRLTAAPVDASYTSRYAYDLRAASRVTFRIVSVPPSPAAEAMKIVPTIVGLAVKDARALLAALEILLVLPPGTTDDASIDSQVPAAGTLFSTGSVTVTVAAPK